MIRFYNCRLLTLDGGFDIKENCELWVNGNTIEYIGEKKDGKFDIEKDCRGNLLMPGFKNAHGHSPMTFLRSAADDLPLDKWLNDIVFPMEALLREEEAVELSKLAFLEYISGGITSVFDMYFYPGAIVEACRQTGFRATLCGAVNNFVSSPKELEADFKKYNGFCDTVDFQLGFHAEYTTSYEILAAIAELSKGLCAPVSAHCAETKKEVAECVERYGKTPVELFNDIGLLDNGGSLFHCNFLSDRDIGIMKERNITAVTNPGSNCKLASGIAPVSKLLSEGINVGIGTDGPASNNALSMFREMYLVTALQKVSTGNAAAAMPEDIIKMACRNGAIAMRSNNDCLREGKLADIIMLDLNKPNMQPVNNIVKNIVYSGGNENIAMTMVNGKILYENGSFKIGEDIEELYTRCQKITERIRGESNV